MDETKKAAHALIDSVERHAPVLASVLHRYLILTAAFGGDRAADAGRKLRAAEVPLRAAVAEKIELERRLAVNTASFVRMAAEFESELADAEQFFRQMKQAAAADGDAHRRQTEIEIEADKMTISDLMYAYGAKLSVNAEGKMVASRGADLSYRDRIILKRWETRLIPILQSQQEAEVI